MSLDFDIAGTPPATTDISASREEAIKERAVYKKKNIRFMLMMLATVAIYVTLMIIYIIPMMGDENPEFGMITYYFPYFTFAIFIVGNSLHIKKIEKPSKALDKTIKSLSEAEEEQLDNIVRGKEHPSNIASYIEKVSAQGRALVGAEVEAIQQWYEANKPKKPSSTSRNQSDFSQML